MARPIMNNLLPEFVDYGQINNVDLGLISCAG